MYVTTLKIMWISVDRQKRKSKIAQPVLKCLKLLLDNAELAVLLLFSLIIFATV
jgi:DNA-binding winged helix-turn-helix (wHTH) protein